MTDEPSQAPMPQWLLIAVMLGGGSVAGGGVNVVGDLVGQSAVEKSIQELADDIETMQGQLGARDIQHERDHLYICAKRGLPDCAGFSVAPDAPSE